MDKIAMIALFGAAGAVARYGVSFWVLRITGISFPYGTLAVNLVGCFLLGLVAHISQNTELIRPPWREGITIGLLGAFTTFSTFGYETMKHLEAGQWRTGLMNIVASVLCGLCAVWLGVTLGRQLYGGA